MGSSTNAGGHGRKGENAGKRAQTMISQYFFYLLTPCLPSYAEKADNESLVIVGIFFTAPTAARTLPVFSRKERRFSCQNFRPANVRTA